MPNRVRVTRIIEHVGDISWIATIDKTSVCAPGRPYFPDSGNKRVYIQEISRTIEEIDDFGESLAQKARDGKLDE